MNLPIKPSDGYRVVRAHRLSELEYDIDDLVQAVEFFDGSVTMHGGVAIDFVNGGFMQAVRIKYEDFNR